MRLPCLLLVAALALSACAGPNAGRATAADFEDWLAEHPRDGVSVTSTGSTENLPFAGVARISIDVAGDDVAGAVEHVCGFEPSAGGSVDLSVTADGVEVPVACDDTDATATTWEILAGLERLTETRFQGTEVHLLFDDGATALAAWDAVRRIPVATDYVLEVVGGWVLTDRAGTSELLRDTARDALAPPTVVDEVTLTPDTPARGEHVEVLVPFDRDLFERELLDGRPERREVLTVALT